jgi:4-hydroxy-tetrahydrodipicolinate reductase
MGRLVAHAVQHSTATLAGGLARAASDVPAARAFPDIQSLAAACDVVIDFTRADTAIPFATALAAAKTAWVIGTTGLDDAQQAAVATAAHEIPIVQAANFAPGVTLFLALAERMAAALDAQTHDAEILEMHHAHKIDAPSGTALALGAAVARGRGVPLADVARTDRTGPRRPGEIGFASLRGGQIIGEHALSFTAAAEQLTLAHRAFDRAVFADGALQAARFVHGRPPGLYGMRDVLGL